MTLCYAWSMNTSMDLRRGRTCVFLMHVHLVFITKYRRRVFTKQILGELKIIFSSVCSDFESHLVEFEGEGDYVHLLIEYPPKVSVSKLVNSLKGVSARLIRKKGTQQLRRPYGEEVFGLQAILPDHVEGRRLLSSDNISSNNNPPKIERARFISALKDRVFSRPRDKNAFSRLTMRMSQWHPGLL